MQAKLSAVRSKLFLHEYENNTHESEQALPAGAVRAGVVDVYILFERSEFLIPTCVTPLYRATSKK